MTSFVKTVIFLIALKEKILFFFNINHAIVFALYAWNQLHNVHDSLVSFLNASITTPHNTYTDIKHVICKGRN